MLENYRNAKRLGNIAFLGNVLLVILILLQVRNTIYLKDVPFLILVVLFGLFTYIMHIQSISLQNKALKDIENKIGGEKDGK